MPTDADLLQNLMNAESGAATPQTPDTGDAKLLNDLMASQSPVQPPVPAGEDHGFLGGAVRGLARGGVGLLEIGAAGVDVLSRRMTTVPMAIPGGTIGRLSLPGDQRRGRFLKGPLDQLAQTEAIQPSASVIAGGTFDPSNPKWWTERGSEILPQLAVQLGIAAASGGASIPGQLATFSTAGGLMAAGSTYGEVYDARIESGETDLEASNGAMLESATVGALTAVIDRIGGAAVLGQKTAVADALRRVVGARVASGGSAALAEGATEMLQEVGTMLAAKGFRGESVAIGEIVDRLGAAGSLGAAAGGAMRITLGPNPEQQANAERAAEARVDDATTQTPIVEPEAPEVATEAGQVEVEAEPAKPAEAPPEPTEPSAEGVEPVVEAEEGDVDGPKLGEIPGFSVDAVKNTLNDAMGSRGTSALDLASTVMEGHNAEAATEGSTENFLESTAFAISPTEFNDLTASQKRRARQNGVEVSETQADAVREAIGEKLYDQAFDEATGTAGAATEQFANQVLQNSEVEDPNLVLAAYLFTQRAEVTPEERGRRRPAMRADDLSVGQNFEILGKRFEVRQTNGERTFVADDTTLNANGLTHLPIDSGTLKNAAGDLLVASNRSGAAIEFELRDVTKRLLARTAKVEALRDQLIRLVDTRLKDRGGVPKSMLRTLQGVKTEGNLAEAIRKVRAHAAKLEHADSAEALNVQQKAAKKAKKMHPKYLKPLTTILDSIGGTAKNPTLTKKINVSKNLPDDSAAMIAFAEAAPVGPLSAQDAIAIAEGIADILNGAKLDNRLRNQNDSMAEAAVVDAMAEELSRDGSLLGERDVDEEGRPIPFKSKNFLGEMSDASLGLESVLTPDVMASVLGGGRDTVTHKILYGLLASASNRVKQGVREGDLVRDEAIKAAGFNEGGIELARLSPIFSPAYDLWQKTQGAVRKPVKADVVEVVAGKSGTVKMHRGERMALALNLRDVETRELIIKGTPITLKATFVGDKFTMTEEQVIAFEAEFSRTPEALIADAMFSHVNGPLRKLTQEWSIAHLNNDITKGYDHWARQRERAGADDDISNALHLMDQKAIEATGLAKERTENNKLSIAVGDAFVSYSNQVWVTNSLAHIAPSIHSANKALKSAKVQKIIKNSGRRNLNDYYTLLFNHLAKEVVGDQRPSVPLERGMAQLANNIGSSALALNPRVVAYQPVSLFAAMPEMGAKYIMRAAASGAFFDTKLDADIDRNVYLADRKNSSGQQLISEGEAAQLQVEGVKQKGYYTFMGIRWADNNAIRVIVQAAKYKAADEGGNALEIAEAVTKRTQPTGDTLHISGLALQARGRPSVKMFTLWRAQLSKQLNMMYDAYLSGDRQKMAAVATSLTMSSLTINVIRAGIAAGLIGLGQAIGSTFFEGDEPEFEAPGGEDALGLLNATVTSLFAHIPIFGELMGATTNIVTNGVLERLGVEAAEEQRVYSPSNPVMQMSADMIGTSLSITKQLAEGDLDDDQLFNASLRAVEAASSLFGLPIVAPLRLGKRVAQGVEESTD